MMMMMTMIMMMIKRKAAVGRHEQVLYEASIRNDVTLARKIIGAAILNHHVSHHAEI